LEIVQSCILVLVDVIFKLRVDCRSGFFQGYAAPFSGVDVWPRQDSNSLGTLITLIILKEPVLSP